MQDRKLRFVVFSMIIPAFNIVRQWIEENGHELALVVTTPGPSARRNVSYKELVNNLSPRQEVLVTTRLRTVAAPLIREIAPDMMFSFAFPYRIPPEVHIIPRLGMVNFHPSPLPAFRGPNALRAIYDGVSEIGGTLHWLDDDFDTGNILAKDTAPLPSPCSLAGMFSACTPMWQRVINEGMEKALEGNLGMAQDGSKASYAAPFTKQEVLISWEIPVELVNRRIWCVNTNPPEGMQSETGYARMMIDGKLQTISASETLNDKVDNRPMGTIVEHNDDGVIVQGLDGQLLMKCTELSY